MIHAFIIILYHYCIEIVPAVVLGFLLSGIINEFIPMSLIEKHLGTKSISGILYATVFGAIVPVCCWGSLPIAVSLYRQGASLGAIVAMLIATPATSVTAFLVTVKFLGPGFAAFLFCSVICMGAAAGVLINSLPIKVLLSRKADEKGEEHRQEDTCPHCDIVKKNVMQRMYAILKYACIEMPKSLGITIGIGLILAALVQSVIPVEQVIERYVSGFLGYIAAVVFSLVTYMCATMSVPFVHALMNKGLQAGPAFVMLLIGPITSYGTILVLGKKFGLKLLAYYIVIIVVMAVFFGSMYTLFL